MPKQENPDLTVIHSESVSDIPLESLHDFKRWVLDEGMLPSKALRKMMEKYDRPNLDVSVTVQLLKKTYPEIDITCGGFRFYLVDSNYPNSDPKTFSDSDFDDGIAKILEHPTKGW